MEINGYAWIVFVGIIWGVTNAIMEIPIRQQNKTGILNIITNKTIVVAFVVNNIGSVMLNFVLGYTDISISLTIVNWVWFICTYVSQKFINRLYGQNMTQKDKAIDNKEQNLIEKDTIKFLIGTVFVVSGVWMWLSDKIEAK